MERIEGGKVTDAFPGDDEQRRRLARRLADVMVYDVMFHPADALFHGDPHAGNVFYVGGEDDPYRIALLDWGLQGVLSYEQRVKLVQVGLGLQLKHADRLRENMDALIDGDIDPDADQDKVDTIVAGLFSAADEIKHGSGEDPGTLPLLDRLVTELALAGYKVDGDIMLYVKSTYTIQTVISDLDPDFDSGDYVAGRVKGAGLQGDAQAPRQHRLGARNVVTRIRHHGVEQRRVGEHVQQHRTGLQGGRRRHLEGHQLPLSLVRRGAERVAASPGSAVTPQSFT